MRVVGAKLHGVSPQISNPHKSQPPNKLVAPALPLLKRLKVAVAVICAAEPPHGTSSSSSLPRSPPGSPRGEVATRAAASSTLIPPSSHTSVPIQIPSPDPLPPSNASSSKEADNDVEEEDGVLEARIHEAMGAEIEAAVGIAVHEAMEAEMEAVEQAVEQAVGQALGDKQMNIDVVANVNTLVALTGVVIFERGVWSAWDAYFGDGFWSDLCSIVVGLSIMVAIRVFNIPLAEWRRPSVGPE